MATWSSSNFSLKTSGGAKERKSLSTRLMQVRPKTPNGESIDHLLGTGKVEVDSDSENEDEDGDKNIVPTPAPTPAKVKGGQKQPTGRVVGVIKRNWRA